MFATNKSQICEQRWQQEPGKQETIAFCLSNSNQVFVYKQNLLLAEYRIVL